jgi:predicted PurR-regulated permease PerM
MNIKNLLIKKSIIFFFAIAIILLFFFKISDILLLFYTAFVIASAIDPIVEKLTKKLPRIYAVLIIYLIGFVIIITILVPLTNILFKQGLQFIRQMPVFWKEISTILDQSTVIREWLGFSSSSSQLLAKLDSYKNLFIERSFGFAKDFFNFGGIISTLALIVFIMLRDKKELKDGYLDLYPDSIRDRADSILTAISKKVGKFTVAQVLSTIVIGFITTIGLIIIGVNYPVLLGVATGVLDIIPTFGPIIALILAILVAFTQPSINLLFVIMLYIFIAILGEQLVKQKVFSKILNLNDLILLLSLLISGKLLGIAGIILSPAFAVTIKVLIQELYFNKIHSKS